jgi:hypothetical protein
MKRQYLILLFIYFFLSTSEAYCQRVSFLFAGKEVGSAQYHPGLSKFLYGLFSTKLFIKINAELPCADYRNLQDVKPCVEELRLQGTTAFGNHDNTQKIKDLVDAVKNSDYWVSSSFSEVSNDMVRFEVECTDRKGKSIAVISTSGAPDDLFGEGMTELVNKFVKQMMKYEICPFKGPVNVHIISKISKIETAEYPVFCNKTDGVYRKKTTVNNKTDTDWKLNKNDKYETTGSVQFALNEETKIEELNDCYKCSSGSEGKRTYLEKSLNTASIQELSRKSQSHGVHIEDARIELTFLDDSTYTISIKAASEQGIMKIKSEKQATGKCDNISNNPQNYDKKIDIGLNQLFGPFKGSAQDKVLTHKNTIKSIDPISEEETLITYEFNLKRD